MEFKVALAMAYRQKTPKLLSAPLLLYGTLSDLCSNDFQAKERVELFYAVDKTLHLFHSVQDSGGDINPLLARYDMVSSLLSAGAFRSLAVLVGEIIAKGGECYYPPPDNPPQAKVPPKTPAKPVPHKKNTPKPTPQIPAHVNQAPQNNVLPTPVTPFAGPNAQTKSKWRNILLVLAPILAVLAGITCLIVFREKIQWWQWQHIIGAIGGLIGFALFIVVVITIDNKQANVAFPAVLMTIAAVTFGLASAYPSSCRILFYWIEAYILVSAIIGALLSFSDCEDGWAFVNCCPGIVAIAQIVVIHFAKEWWQWQHVIGSFGGLTLGFIATVILFYLYDEHDVEWYRPVLVAGGLLSICNIVLGFVLCDMYKILFYWIAAWLTLFSIIGAYGANDDVEGGWTAAGVIETIVTVGSIVLVRFLA